MNFFDKIIIRVVSFPVQSYGINRNNLANFFSENKLFQLCILISSRILYDDIKKNKTFKVKSSLEKYFSRAHFNPVPFGTFSSIGILNWGDKTIVTKSKFFSIKVDFDNYYFQKENNYLIKENWKTQVFHINPSVHFLNNTKVSLYKYDIKPNGIFESSYVEIEYDENIEWLINRFQQGANMSDVLTDLLESGFQESEIDNFIFEIINVGLIIAKTSYYPYNKKIISGFKEIHSELVNQNIHHLMSSEDFEIFVQKYIDEQNADVNNKNTIHQLHNVTSFENDLGQLDSSIQKKIKAYVDFCLSYNNNSTINDKLKEFGNLFYHNFNDGFVPLAKVFNPYSGLNYSSIKSKKTKELHSDLIAEIVSATTKKVSFSMPKSDFKEQKGKREKLPATFTVIFEILLCKITGKEIIYFKHLGEASAINLIARFGYVTEETCKDIANYEKEVNPDKIIAEVNMISNSRSLNLFANRQYYDYNIPLNTTCEINSNTIFLSDIFIRFDGNKFIDLSV